MTEIKPATPAQAATPGNEPKGVGNPPAASPDPTKTGASGNQQGATVTITAEELRELQRHKARSLAFDKRKQFVLSKNNPQPPQTPNDGNADPELVERIRVEQEGRTAAERKALQLEVKGKVRDLLERDEFKVLPASTKALILKSPHMLSEADNVDEALLDIEEFLIEQVSDPALSKPITNLGGQNPPGHETPPAVNSAVPAAVNAEGLEDTSKLTGVTRSRAVLQNAMKKKKGVV